MKKLCVIGSLNMDLVIGTDYPPVMGETVHGHNFQTVPGGKGANQAIAAAKLGNAVSMIGMIGSDGFGTEMIENLKKSGVDPSGVETDGTSGIAVIVVSQGDNTIILDAGANGQADNALIDRHTDLIETCDTALFQLEIPPETVLYTMKKAKALGKKVLLNPAPIAGFQAEMLRYTDILILNEHEAGSVLGKEITDPETASEACRMLQKEGVEQVIVTLGSAGCVYTHEGNTIHQSAFPVKAVDSTAAGDSFIGAFCAECDHLGVPEAVRYASAVSAVTVSRLGASVSIPTRDEVQNMNLL